MEQELTIFDTNNIKPVAKQPQHYQQRVIRYKKHQQIIQHINQYIELIEIVEEISAKSDAQAAELNKDQARLAQKVQKAFSALQVQVLDSAQELAPALGAEVLQRIAQVTAQLQADLVAVTGIHVVIQAPTEPVSEISSDVEAFEKQTAKVSVSETTTAVSVEPTILEQVDTMRKTMPTDQATSGTEIIEKAVAESNEVVITENAAGLSQVVDTQAAQVQTVTDESIAVTTAAVSVEPTILEQVDTMGKGMPTDQPTSGTEIIEKAVAESNEVVITENTACLSQVVDTQAAQVQTVTDESIAVTTAAVSVEPTILEQVDTMGKGMPTDQPTSGTEIIEKAVAESNDVVITENTACLSQVVDTQAAQAQTVTDENTAVEETEPILSEQVEAKHTDILGRDNATIGTEEVLSVAVTEQVAIISELTELDDKENLEEVSTSVKRKSDPTQTEVDVSEAKVSEAVVAEQTKEKIEEAPQAIDNLIQPIQEYICEDVTEVISELPHLVNSEELKRSVNISKQLLEHIAASETEKAETSDVFKVDLNEQQVVLAHQLQIALTEINIVPLDTLEELPVSKKDILQHISLITETLNADLCAVITESSDKVKTKEVEEDLRLDSAQHKAAVSEVAEGSTTELINATIDKEVNQTIAATKLKENVAAESQTIIADSQVEEIEIKETNVVQMEPRFEIIESALQPTEEKVSVTEAEITTEETMAELGEVEENQAVAGSAEQLVLEEVAAAQMSSVVAAQAQEKTEQPLGNAKIAMATHMAERNMIMDSLRDLYESLASKPAETELAEPPAGMTCQLMPYQLHALAWLHWRETQRPRAGILADDMGLGKTITMIALMVSDKEKRIDDDDDGNSDVDEDDNNRTKERMVSGGTLVVCPASLVQQWDGEVGKHCTPHALSVCLHHGAARAQQPHRLAAHDLVLTTYNILRKDNEKKGVLMRVRWRRAILDEAHVVRNHKTATAAAAAALRARRRWCLTGTPVHNKDLDLFALLNFLRCTPFDDLTMWKKWIDNKTLCGQKRLSTIMSSILLARTKAQLQQRGQLACLPARTAHERLVTLSKEEMNVYQKVLVFSKTLFAQFLHHPAEKNSDGSTASGKDSEDAKMYKKMIALQGSKSLKSHEILVLLLRLRQVCCHCGLIAAILDEQDKEAAVQDLLAELTKLSLEDSRSRRKEQEDAPEPESTTADEAIRSVLSPNNPVFDLDSHSSKIQAVMDCLVENVFNNEGDKAVVVSQWTSVLQLVERGLRQLRVRCVTLSGAVAVPARAPLIAALNDPNNDVKVMLLSLCAGGVGLNLCGANHLLLLDPHWNPQLEEQAQDRIYRVGQKKPVHIYRFLCVDTVEETIRTLQKAKLELAENLLTGARNTNASKLTIEDLKMLFNTA